MLVFGGFLGLSILGVLYARHQLKEEVSGGIITFQFILALMVEVNNVLISNISRWLTNNENHRTQSTHDTHLLWKVMGFKFINSYFVLYYIAFVKDHSYLFGTPMKCIRSDCFLDLQAQLAVFTVVNLTVKNIWRFVYPRLKTIYRTFKVEGQVFMDNCTGGHNKLELADLSSAEMQSKLENYDAFADFDEMLITHGYAHFFAVSAPWVCAATLLWAMCELLLDMKGLTGHRKRPFPTRVRGADPWTLAFRVYGVVAAVTNIALLVFVSDLYASWTFSMKVLHFLFLGHLIYFFYWAIKIFLPEIPRSVEMMHMKQEIIVQRCLENITVEHHQQDISALRMRDSDEKPHEVHELDPADEDEDMDPQWSCAESWRVMHEGLLEHLPRRLVHALFVALLFAAVTAAGVYIMSREQMSV